MKLKTFVNSFLLSVSLLAMHSQAVLIEGYFTGSVQSFENGTEDGIFEGYWENVTLGSPVTGSFWYDTDKAPGNSAVGPHYTEYLSYTDEWMGSSFTIDGKTYAVSDHVPLGHSGIELEGFYLFDLLTTPDYPYPAKEIFYLFDNITSYDGLGGNSSIGFAVEVSKEGKGLLNGMGVIQEFDWYNLGDPTTSAWAYVSLGYSTAAEKLYSVAWIDIDEIHVKIKKPTEVPEPTSLWLLLGVGSLLLLRRKLLELRARVQ